MTMIDKHAAELAISQFLSAMGFTQQGEGSPLHGTPERVVKAFADMTSGYASTAEQVVKTTTGDVGFTGDWRADQMIVLTGYLFTSMCEHHLLPFTGRADVGYIPGDAGLVVGVSKLGRLVNMHAHRLQMQERLTQGVANDLLRVTTAKGVGVRVRAAHACMHCRGLRNGATMATEALLGVFRLPEVRAEFWNLCAPLEKT